MCFEDSAESWDGLDSLGGFDTAERKRMWRRAYLARRCARMAIGSSDVARGPSGDSLTRNLESIIGPFLRVDDNGECAVAIYEPFASEPDVEPLIRVLCAAPGVTVLVPTTRSAHSSSELPFKELVAIPDDQGDQEGRGGDAERPTNRIPLRAVVVPALCLSATGERLGRGAGWYDRVLASLMAVPGAQDSEPPVLIGVCFDDELVDGGLLPTDRHDQKIDMVVTERRVVHC